MIGKFFFSFLLLVSAVSHMEACTGIRLIAKDGSFVHGRTLEFGLPVDVSSAFIPRGYSFVGTTPLGKGLAYQSKYASVGAIAFDALAILDGINEKGLAVGAFYFPTFAEYVPTTQENISKSVSPLEFTNWIITQFATVEEVKTALPNVVIAPTISKEWGNIAPPLHYIVYDKMGNCLVLEPTGGKLVVHENKIGVFTNSPTFDWHMTNLRNYIHLSPENAKPLKLDGLELFSFGQGSGMIGLPGDFTPPSRFVRASIFCVTSIPSQNAKEAIFQGFHILNQFDIPYGVARETVNGKMLSDFTQITCMRDPQSLIFYFKTYEDPSIRYIDLKKFDPTVKEARIGSTKGKEKATDFSSELAILPERRKE